MFELRRSDIGFGKLVVDDHGIVREKLFRKQQIAWSDVREYRIKLQFVSHSRNFLLREPFGIIMATVDAARGDSLRLYGMELVGATDRVAFNWRYRDTLRAIEFAVQKVEPRITDAARAVLRDTGVIRFGPISLAAHGISYRDRTPIAANLVEALELFDHSPLVLRIIKKGKSFADESVKVHTIPNPQSLLTLAGELGYTIRGKEFLPLMQLPPARVTSP